MLVRFTGRHYTERMSDTWLQVCYRIPGTVALMGALLSQILHAPTGVLTLLALSAPVLFIGGVVMGNRAVERRNTVAPDAEQP